MDKSRNTILIIISFFSIYVIWGSTYLLNKIAVTELPPFMLASVRAGFLFLTFGNGIVVWALKYVDSGFAALEISAQPLVVLLLMRIFEGKKIETMSVIGVVLGVIGIYLLVSQKQLISNEDTILGMIMIFACMISWGYGSLFVGKADLPSNYFVNTGYQMLMGGLMLMLNSYLFGETWSLPMDWSFRVQYSLVLLIIFGSIVAFTSFNYLLKIVSPEKVATSTYVNPIIAMGLGWYFLNEHITTQSIFAAIILLTGVYFINTKKKIIIYSRFRK